MRTVFEMPNEKVKVIQQVDARKLLQREPVCQNCTRTTERMIATLGAAKDKGNHKFQHSHSRQCG